jgi:hypothetical protein
MIQPELVTAAVLEKRGILKKGTAYRMAKLNLIPCAKVGPKRRGIRFSPADVLAALRQSVPSEER